MDIHRITEITRKNLSGLDKLKYSADTRRSLHIRELGIALAEDMPRDPEELEEFCRSYLDIAEELSLSAEENILLCRYIAESFGDMRDLIPILPAKRRCRLSYVKNPLSDLAYDSFSMFFDKAAVSYSDEFVSAAEDVYHSISDYVILPVYSQRGGRLKSFCDLADKYELKKVLSCRVYSNTEDAETEFALFSRSCERFPGNRRTEVSFEFSLGTGDLKNALGYLWQNEGQIQWISTSDDRADICLEIPENEVSALYIYLTLCLPDREIKGIY